MTAVTKVGTVDVSFTKIGSQFNGQGGYLPYTGVVTRRFTVATEVTDSVRTPNFWRKSIQMVKFVPRSGRVPTFPRRPTFFEPPKPKLRDRRLNQTDGSWSRALARHKVRLRTFEINLQRKRSLYESRLAKYHVRVAKYNAYMKKVAEGVPRKVRVRVNVSPQWNPYSYTLTGDTGAVGTWRTFWRQWYYYKEILGSYAHVGNIERYVYGGTWPPSSSSEVEAKVESSAESLALNRFHEKLTGELVHLGQMLAERAQTIGLLADAVKRLAQFLLSFRLKGIIRTVKNAIKGVNGKNVANDYLAFQFGVKPLISDVQGSAEAVAHFVVDNIAPFVRIATQAEKSEEKTEIVYYNGKPYVFTTRVTVKVRYVCEYELENLVTREMSKLGVFNPAEIIWELIPWSFVVDWVYPIGDYLRHLTNDAGLSFKRGTRTITTTKLMTCKLSFTEKDPNTGTKYWGSDNWSSWDVSQTKIIKSKKRAILSKPPMVEVPKFKNPISLTHVLESLALLYQQRFK